MKHLFIILFLVAGCTNAKKATSFMFAHPEVNAPVCAIQFPVKDSLIKGDSVIITDTVTTEGKTDTVTTKDTVRITKTLPAKVITRTVTRVDTIVKENTARVFATLDKLSACNNELIKKDVKITDLQESLSAMKKSRNKFRLWLFIAIGAAGMFTFLKIKKIL